MGKVIDMAEAFRRLPVGPRKWPVGHLPDVEEVHVVLENRRLLVWRWTEPCPDRATHWRPIAA